MLIITVLYVLKSGERKRHLSYPPQFSETAAVKTQTRCPRHAPDDADPPRGSLHEHRNSHLEALHRAYDSHENRLDLASEISNLKDAYRILDIRINNCISPTRAGLNKLAVASSQRCSQSNEGGVTYGASAWRPPPSATRQLTRSAEQLISWRQLIAATLAHVLRHSTALTPVAHSCRRTRRTRRSQRRPAIGRRSAADQWQRAVPKAHSNNTAARRDRARLHSTASGRVN